MTHIDRFWKFLVFFYFFSSVLGINSGCATRRTLSYDYRQKLGPLTADVEGIGTTVLFLIDGLSYELLDEAVRSNRVPETEAFFKVGPAALVHPLYLGNQISAPAIGKAIASFPTLTYPNISSVLTAESIDQHGVLGNQIFRSGPRGTKVLNFESLEDREDLNHMLAGHTVFDAGAGVRRRNVSLSFYFRSQSATALRDDLKTGIAYETMQYDYIDRRVIDSLYYLLADTSPDRWPSFIFIHLIGVDSLSHELGPYALRVRDYLRGLDSSLAPIYHLLDRAEREKGKLVSTVLTADHGFMAIDRQVDVITGLRKRFSNAVILDQGRLVAVHTTEKLTPETLSSFAANDGVDVVASRAGDRIRIEGHEFVATIDYDFSEGSICFRAPYRLKVRLSPKAGSVYGAYESDFSCPEILDTLGIRTLPPYFASKIATYFNAANRPDLLLLPAEGVTFGPYTKGQHGGLTLKELEVPLLLRGLGLSYPERTFHTDDLLKFLK